MFLLKYTREKGETGVVHEIQGRYSRDTDQQFYTTLLSIGESHKLERNILCI